MRDIHSSIISWNIHTSNFITKKAHGSEKIAYSSIFIFGF